MKHIQCVTMSSQTLQKANAATIISIVATVLTAIAGLLQALQPLIGNKNTE